MSDTAVRIGEKIRRLRREKMMTQQELAGNVITRNMLSAIENGSAGPSMPTLTYLAEKLRVPVGYLLCSEEEENVYRKLREIGGMRRAFEQKNHTALLTLCRESLERGEADAEETLLHAEAALAVAREEMAAGRLRSAAELLDEAIERARACPYYTCHIVAEAALTFGFLRRFSPTFESGVLDAAEDVDVLPALTGEWPRFYEALGALDRDDAAAADALMAKADKNSVTTLYYKSYRQMQAGDYAAALRGFNSVFDWFSPIPEPLLCFLFRDMEVCCRETEDFRGAYEYSNAKRERYEKILSE